MASPQVTEEKPAQRPEAADLAGAALASLTKYGLPMTPQTFAIWYEYHRGGIPELNRVVDILSSNKVGMTEERLSSLYAKYIGSPEAYLELRAMTERMQQTIEEMTRLLHEAGEDATRINASVRDAAGSFARQETSIEVLIRSLLAEAQLIVARTNQMEAELTRNAELLKSMQRSLDDTKKAALTDGLTGLANRRHFDDTMQKLAGQAMNDGFDLSLVLIDIDHFKRINDNFGHPVGDQVLQLVGATLRGTLRPNDFAARYGGEEFAIVLARTSSEVAAEIANRLREAFSSKRVVVRDTKQEIGLVTLSAGVGSYLPGESLTDWLKRTDAALYSAKQGGRNRVVQA